jgi:2-polyprenyl-6-hydroxyphenyl methylase / 3-demethylubiquinone-9 3-methyltransferase
MENGLINNEFYHGMGNGWYEAKDHPIALLRRESEVKTKWILEELEHMHLSPSETQVLDVACGAGFLCNELARNYYKVTGVDLAADAIVVAKRFDKTETVRYLESDAGDLPFPDASFEVVTCLDFLEHITDHDRVIREISRVLKPGGTFFFHTLNRNWLSYLVVIKGVEWFVKNTPPHMHVYSMLVKPEQVETSCRKFGMPVMKWMGTRPVLNSGFLRMLSSGRVDDDFRFTRTNSRLISYLGMAKKTDGH